jgi:diacylglycerol O-acyltransferase / wax synthase
MSKNKLNNVDFAWLRMDHANNPMMITVVFRFSGQVNYDRLITSLELLVGRFHRFRQCLVRPRQIFSRPYWEDDPVFQVEGHVELVRLQDPADDHNLMELVSQKMSMTLDFAHPLWQITLIENFLEGSALILRIHHCIADGVSLMQILLLLAQLSPDTSENQIPEQSAAQLAKAASRRGRDTLYGNHPTTETIAAFARILFRRPDPPTIFKGPLGPVKKAVWSEPLDLSEVKKIARLKQATSNDVLMAVASGAIRRYMDLNGQKRKRNLRAFTMVNLRRRLLDEELGNKFGMVFLTLPLDREQPLESLEEVKRGMDSLKNSAESATTFLILNLLGMLPGWIEHLATMFLDTKGTVVATNIAGPHRQIYLAGAPIQSIITWVPQSGRIGVGWSFVTYNNQVQVAVNTDAGLIPDPEKLLELFTDEYRSFQAVLSSDIPEKVRQKEELQQKLSGSSLDFS